MFPSSRERRSEQRTSVTVYGASGFTGAFVVEELLRRLPALRKDVPNFSWAIAGRSRASLERIVASIRMTTPADAKLLPSIVVADVSDEHSLKVMAESTKLVLNCVGPYHRLGEPVVHAVILASEELRKRGEPACDYADLTGEPGWIEAMVLKYSARAKAAGCAIVHAAAFDSVPSDMGIELAKQELKRKGAVPAGAEMFFELRATNGQVPGFGFATYASAINGFSQRAALSQNRKRLYGSLLPRPAPRAKALGLSLGLPKRRIFPGGGLTWSSERKCWLVPFFFADPAVIRLSQALELADDGAAEVVQLVAWAQMPSTYVLFLSAFYFLLFGMLVQFEAGRRTLLRHPKFFTGGLFTNEGPTQAQMDATSFETTIVAYGHSRALLESKDVRQSRMGTDTKISVVIRGPEPGYRATPLLFLAVARSILVQRQEIPSGVLTPAAALRQTSILDDLRADGRIAFDIVSAA